MSCREEKDKKKISKRNKNSLKEKGSCEVSGGKKTIMEIIVWKVRNTRKHG